MQVFILHNKRVFGLFGDGKLHPGQGLFFLKKALQTEQFIPQGAINFGFVNTVYNVKRL